jgi:hypothetical protein
MLHPPSASEYRAPGSYHKAEESAYNLLVD